MEREKVATSSLVDLSSVGVRVCWYVCVCMYVCVCVSGRETEREGDY